MPRSTPERRGCGVCPGAMPFSATFVTIFATAILLVLIPLGSGHAQESAASLEAADGPVVIEAEDFAFDAPDEIPSGWTHLRYVNTGEEPHLLFLVRLPDGKTLEEYQIEAVAPFDAVWQALKAGVIDQDEANERLATDLPEWFWTELENMGGVGLVPAGETADVTLDLPPGTYVMECYVKTDEGEFHTMEGMIRELTVTEAPSGASPPEADVEITLSNFEMDIHGDLTPGKRTVAVHVAEHPEEGFGHNVHVVREPGVETDEILRWLNFLEIDGLMPPAPATFAGGIQILAEGATGYFTLDVEPGDYLFVSELTGARGVLRHVTVEP